MRVAWVITNNHVVDEADEVTVTLTDNTKFKATILGRDKKTDLALLKIESKKPLPFVSFGDSDTARVGDWVIAIGNPFGLGGTVTQGIVSARQRSINAGPFDDFIQTDAPINRGNSGGPLFNLSGEVIGINSAIFSPSGGNIGIGFAIPSSLAKPVITQLKEFGRTHRGWLGVKIQEVTEEVADSLNLPKTMGALVLEATAGSPSAKAGILAGDVITSYNGHEITQMRFLPRMVAETKIGSTVPMTLWRKGKAMTVQVTLGEMNEAEEKQARPEKVKGSKPDFTFARILGMNLATLNDTLRKRYKIPAKQPGVLIAEVMGGTEAEKRGLRSGDVLLGLNSQPVTTTEDASKIIDIARKDGRKFVLVGVLRGKDTAYLTLPVDEK